MTRRPADNGGLGRLARRLKDYAHLPADRALSRLGHSLKRPVFALPFYRYSLPGLTATTLAATPTDPWPGRAELGGALLQGVFTFAGQSLSNPSPLWSPPGAGIDWRRDMHSFAWLRDLRALGGDAARRQARDLVRAWLEAHRTWSLPAWEPLVSGRRLASWLGCFEFFAASAEIEFRHRLLASIAQQAQHLCRALPAGLGGAELIAAAKGLIFAGAALPGGEVWRARGLEILRRELAHQILPDGGHIERSPSCHMAVLRDLIDIRGALARVGPDSVRVGPDSVRMGPDAVRMGPDAVRVGPDAVRVGPDAVRVGPDAAPDEEDGTRRVSPSELTAAIEALAPVLRMYQHGDGGLALFNGSLEEEGWRVDLVLQRAGGPRRPIGEAPESGFQRLHAGRTTVLVDTGMPPPRGLDGHAHAGALSLEMSAGRERILVNCGTRPNDPTWHRAQRATAAHSTLVLGDTNSAQLRTSGLGRAARITYCQREEKEGQIWLEAAHDGYGRGFGALHRRRLFLSADGGDLRGEDCLEPVGQRVPRGLFAVRFHLHPGVRASLAQGGDSVLLRPPKGDGWSLHAAGAQVSLEPSIYLGQAEDIRRSQQVVLSGALGPDGIRIKWALRRLDPKRK